MTSKEVFKELEGYGNPGTKKVFLKHGAREPFYGVKVQDLKKIVKKIKKDHGLSLELYATGNSDAMYLAGLIADETQITKDDLNRWADEAYWYMISEYTVAWITSETEHGWALGLEWIESDEERIAAAGWATLASIAAIRPGEELDFAAYDRLLSRVEKDVHKADNRVRYTMNGFVIAVGSYVESLSKRASQVAEAIGKVSVNVGDTACKVPLATDYIKKIVDKGRVGKKRNSARC